MFQVKLVKELKAEIVDLKQISNNVKFSNKQEYAALDTKYENLKRHYELQTQEELNKLKTIMAEELAKSDILRVEALAKLEIYEKMDVKNDANMIKEMVGKLIDKIGSQKSELNVIK